ncbi:type III-A CRISPR-associated protein Csm2 [Thermotoga sp. KOL6]|nr:type III-A CRISPR-associated protein Csm2 [Thermotoga sp. KOL6]
MEKENISLKKDVKELVREAERLSQELKKLKLNTTQLRKFHGYLTKIWSKYIYRKNEYSDHPEVFRKEILDDIHFMKIFLAYQVGRGQSGVEKLKETLEPLIDEIENGKDFEKFKKFYDAIVAYHKFYLSKENSEEDK